jgi:putative DNA primase/helicase
LIVEGEKAADVAQLIFPDHIAITSPGGSRAAGKAEWEPLNGRRVVIWPDSDDAGTNYANDVARHVSACGASSVAVVAIPGDFPSKWDLADAMPDGWNKNRLQTLIDNSKTILELLCILWVRVQLVIKKY